METDELIKILKQNDEFLEYCSEDFSLDLISDKYNLVYKVKEREELHIKVGLRGWGRYEWQILKILFVSMCTFDSLRI